MRSSACIFEAGAVSPSNRLTAFFVLLAQVIIPKRPTPK
jgi:hypothetical protein